MISADDKSGFEVIVHRTGGEAFNEYDVKHTEGGEGAPGVSSCWLESEQDATFTVKVKIGPEMASRQHQYDWLIEIFVDGRMITNRVVSKDPKGREVSVAHMTFEEAGVKYDGLLKFAALKTTDKDDEVTLNGELLHSLGKIRVDIFRGTKGAYTGGQHACLIAPDVGVAAEKSKKLGGGIGCGEKSAYRPISTVLWHAHDDVKVPFHRLELNYRPRTVLQLQGVIDHEAPRPRAPTPPASVVPQAGPSRKRKVDVIDIDADEEDSDVKPDNKDRLTTRVGWLERQLQNANKILKRRRVIAPADIVDLTGDD